MKARPVLSILGGSSPFTAGFVQAAVDAGAALPPYELVLQGRSADALCVLQRHAEARLSPLGWTVRSTSSRDRALEGAAVVLHQVRYGGLEGRGEGERLAARFQVHSDETLGLAALQCALRTAPQLRALGQALAAQCPDAWVLNLTNPLSLTTSLLSRHVRRCLGLCELPRVTLEFAARRLRLAPERLSWSYSGLNHRGFLHDVSVDGADVLPSLAEGEGELNGIPPTQLRALGALPLKYFNLLSAPASAAGRAEFLSGLRDQAIEELRAHPAKPPPSLGQRYMEWYPLSVVPFLAALAANDGRTEVVNLPEPDGLVREVRARVFADRLEPLRAPPPPAPAARWLERFEAHERECMAVLAAPSLEGLERVLAKDPLVPPDVAGGAAQQLWREHQEMSQ